MFSCFYHKQEKDIISESTVSQQEIKYLALGDSYTIGEGVPAEGSFPLQLAEALRKQGYKVPRPNVIARTGWRTDNLKNAVDQAQLPDTFNLVTLLIGVNNQYQGRSVASYEPEFLKLLQIAVQKAQGRKEQVIVVSIPDYGYTPFGANNQVQISAAIDAYNQVNKKITDSMGIAYVNITPISREAKTDPALLASDRLHPSASMYQRWVALILPEVRL